MLIRSATLALCLSACLSEAPVDSGTASPMPADPGPDAEPGAEPEGAPAEGDTPGAGGGTAPGEQPDPGEEAPPEEVPPELEWAACDLGSEPAEQGFPEPVSGVLCTTLSVPLDHDEPDGERIELRIARHPARSGEAAGAVFQLAGGPGGGSVVHSGLIPGLLRGVRSATDLVYVDQRGTGGSATLDCPFGWDGPGSWPRDQRDWLACADELSEAGLEHFLTLDAAHDLEAVREALGYETIHLRGGSYGTRLALEYMRQHPDRVGLVVLDGAAPPDLDILGEGLGANDRGVDLLVEQCASSAECDAVAPDLGVALRRRRALLRANPRRITFDGYRYEEDEALFMQYLSAFLHQAGWRERVPRAIREAMDGDNGLWNDLMGMASGVRVEDADSDVGPGVGVRATLPPLRHRRFGRSYVSAPVFMNVLCAEWAPNSGGLATLRELAQDHDWSDDTGLMWAEVCQSWPIKPLSAELRAPVESDAKVLLVSGQYDLNTFPEWADRTAESLTDARHVVVPGGTHSTLMFPCAGDMMARWLTSGGDDLALTADCLDDLARPQW